MAEQSKGDSAFEVLGRIVVDLDALKRSLNQAEAEVRANAERLKRIWAEPVGPGAPGAPGQPPAPGVPEERARSMGREFSILARTIRMLLAGPLEQINPALGHATSAMSIGARSAVFMGVGFGVAMVAGIALSVALSKFISTAKEMTAATLDASQALATLDAGRAESGIKKITEELAAFNLELDIVQGRVTAGVWQKIIANITVAMAGVTGVVQSQLDKLKNYVDVFVKIQEEVVIPKALVESARANANILERQAQLLIKGAESVEQLAAAYKMLEDATKKKTKAAIDDINIDEKVQIAALETTKRMAQRVVDEAARAKAKAEAAGYPTTGATGFEQGFDEKARAEEEFTKLQVANQAIIARSDEALTNIKKVNAGKRADSQKSEAMTHREQAAKSWEDIERLIAQDQRRVASTGAAAKAILASEQSVAEARRKHLGVVESEADIEERLADTRRFEVGPIISNIDAMTEAYEKQKKVLDGLIEATNEQLKTEKSEGKREEISQKLDYYTKLRAALELKADRTIGESRKDLARAEADIEAKAAAEREARVQRRIQLEDKRMSHAVAMGRVSMQEEMRRAEVGAQDPRRSAEQQAEQEEKLLQLKKQYADEYFKYYQALGASTWAQQISSATYFIEQTVEGSKQWFDAVQKLAGVYKQIHEEAKGIFQQQLAISKESTRREAEGPKTSLAEIAKDVAHQRRVDVRVLASGRGTRAQLAGAINRQDLYRTMDREGLSPAEAFARAQQDPAQQLAQTLAQVTSKTSQYGNVLDVVARSTYDAGSALKDLADAAGDAAGALRAIAANKNVNIIGPDPSLRNEGGRYGKPILRSEDGKYNDYQPSSVSEDNAAAQRVANDGGRGPR